MSEESPEAWWSSSTERPFSALGSSLQGLSSNLAATRLASEAAGRLGPRRREGPCASLRRAVSYWRAPASAPDRSGAPPTPWRSSSPA